jgi:hypothetical protein
MRNFEQEIPAVPIIPFRGLSAETSVNFPSLEQTLYEKRKNVLTGENQKQQRLFLSQNTRAITPQGLMVEVAADGNYNWIGLGHFSDMSGSQENLPDMRFTHVDQTMRQQFQQKELVYVIDSADALEAAAPSDGFQFSIEGVGFSLLPDHWRTQEESPTMMVIQYSASKSMKETLGENEIFQKALSNAYTKDGDVKDEYKDLIDAVDDSGFQGILALHVWVSLDEMPAEIQFLMTGIDRERFYAPYLIVRTGGVEYEKQTEPVLRKSSVSGLAEYTVDEKLIYQNTPPDYDYMTTEIRIQIQENHLTSFFSSSEVLLNRIFEAKAVAADNSDGNCLILQGSLVGKDDRKTYQYHLKQSVVYQLTGSAIESVCIQKLDLLTEKQGNGCFSLSGVLNCRNVNGADLFGYGGQKSEEGLPFSQLNLIMEQDISSSATQYSMEYGLLNWDRETAVLRADSFPAKFAVHLDGLLVEKNGETPEQKGYTSMNVPVRQSVPEEQYQGFRWSISLGNLGALSGTEGITLELITAFWCNEDGGTSYYAGYRIPALLSAETLKLQGIFQLGFKSVSLEQKDEDYLIRLHNFHVELFGASFPQNNSDIFIFSDGEHIGWYGAYQEE